MTEQELNGIRAFFGHVARPRAVTVTAVLWLFLGVSWLVGGTFGLGFVMWMTSQLAQFAEQGADIAGPPLVFFWYPGGAVALGAAGKKLGSVEVRYAMRPLGVDPRQC